MAEDKAAFASPYSRCTFPPPPPPPPPLPDTNNGDYVAIPLYSDAPLILLRRRPRNNRIILTAAFSTLLFFSILYLLWPSDPKLLISQMKLDHIGLHRWPRVSLDFSLALKVRVYNRDFFSFHYHHLEVKIFYRGNELGHVWSEDGSVKPLSSSYIHAVLDLNGLDFLSDAFFLLEDFSKGVIPFDTVTDIRGMLGLFFFRIPIKAKISCEVEVNPVNQTIIRQNCYPGIS